LKVFFCHQLRFIYCRTHGLRQTLSLPLIKACFLKLAHKLVSIKGD
jgi:hypothetical protein